MKPAIVTYFYPGAEKFLKQFIHSVQQQTISCDVIVFNHNGDKEALLNTQLALNVIEISKQYSVVEVRRESFDYLRKTNYNAFVFLDIDDEMSANRVEVCCKLLTSHKIVCNNLSLIDEFSNINQNQIWSNRIQEKERITSQFIRKHNILGFSNTSIQKCVLDVEIYFKDVIAADWLIFTQLLSYFTACFTSDCSTYYRQHSSNIAGLNKNITLSRLNKVKLVREKHYKALEEFNIFKHEKNDNFIFNKELKLPFYPFWWEEIELYETYTTNTK